MPSQNKILYEKALEAIKELFGDTSVGVSTAKRNLNSLIGEIQIMVEALEHDEEAMEAEGDDEDEE
jgi:hypothetical protein